jgi:Uma2 family endonuclease
VTAMEYTPIHLYTVNEYAALGDTEQRTELQEGVIVMSPSPARRHVKALIELTRQIQDQLPGHLEVLIGIDVNLELARADQPGFVRRPELIVGDSAAFERTEAEGKLMRASDVLLIAEIVSPGSRRMDYRTKRGEYADAGIPHYWIVDLDKPVSVLACRLTEEFGYVDNGETTGKFTITEPFAATINLAALL